MRDCAKHAPGRPVVGSEHNQAADYQACLGVALEEIEVLHNPVRVPADSARLGDVDIVKFVSLGRLGKRKVSYDLVQAVALLPSAGRERVDFFARGRWRDREGVQATMASAFQLAFT